MEPTTNPIMRMQLRETNTDPFSESGSGLPMDVIRLILSRLKCDFPACALVNKRWKQVVDTLHDQNYPEIAVGAEKWKRYLGDPGVEPRLPRRVHKDLLSGQRYLLTLIPKSIGGEPFTITKIAELVKKPKEGHPIKGLQNFESIIRQYGKDAPSVSYWALITEDDITGTKGQKPADQEKRVTNSGHRTPQLLEMITSKLVRFVITGNAVSSPIYSRVKERVYKDAEQYHIVVGDVKDGTLRVDHYNGAFLDTGMAGAQPKGKATP